MKRPLALTEMPKSLLSILVNTARFVVGGTFLLSGFTKALDPAGTSLKANAWLSLANLQTDEGSIWLSVASVALITLEFLIGIHLILGIRRRLFSIISALFTFIFTLLTLYLYTTDAQMDCGCFGDAIILTNAQTFWKNVALLILCLPMLIWPRRMFWLISKRGAWISTVFSLFYILVLSVYSLHFLPLIDFLPFKTGTNLAAIRSGEDTKALAGTDERTLGQIFNLAFYDGQEDVTDELLSDTGNTFLLVSPRLEYADDGIADQLNDLDDLCTDKGWKLYLVTASDSIAQYQWTERTGTEYEVLTGEDEQLKALVRSNPGLIALRDGIITGKWSRNNLPLDHKGNLLEAAFIPSPASTASVLRNLALWFILPLFFIIFADALWTAARKLRQRNLEKASAEAQMTDTE